MALHFALVIGDIDCFISLMSKIQLKKDAYTVHCTVYSVQIYYLLTYVFLKLSGVEYFENHHIENHLIAQFRCAQFRFAQF